MRFPASINPAILCSTDDYRPHIKNPVLYGDFLFATNGAAIVQFPIERGEKDVDGPIPKAIFSQAKPGGAMKDEIEIHCTSERFVFKTDAGITEVFRNQSAEVIPLAKVREVIGEYPEAKPLEIAFNPTQLASLASAMGCQMVMIQFGGKESAITVKPAGFSGLGVKNGTHAVLMPYKQP